LSEDDSTDGDAEAIQMHHETSSTHSSNTIPSISPWSLDDFEIDASPRLRPNLSETPTSENFWLQELELATVAAISIQCRGISQS
jgi:hypothetical protein